jgi:hypothetical protein
MSPKQKEAIKELRDAGYAVAVWSPDELGLADPVDAQDEIITAGNNIIQRLKDEAEGIR